MATFEGHVSQMRDSQWLASEDLLDRGDVTVTIERVEKHKNVVFEDNRTKPVLYALKFKGSDKRLVLNSTNRKAVTKMHGALVSSWPGKKITLYVQHNIKVGRETKSGIRIRTPQ